MIIHWSDKEEPKVEGVNNDHISKRDLLLSHCIIDGLNYYGELVGKVSVFGSIGKRDLVFCVRELKPLYDVIGLLPFKRRKHVNLIIDRYPFVVCDLRRLEVDFLMVSY